MSININKEALLADVNGKASSTRYMTMNAFKIGIVLTIVAFGFVCIVSVICAIKGGDSSIVNAIATACAILIAPVFGFAGITQTGGKVAENLPIFKKGRQQ